MKEKKQPIALDLDIFIHLMTSAYREGFKAGSEHASCAHDVECASAVTQFRYGMLDMLKEPENTIQH